MFHQINIDCVPLNIKMTVFHNEEKFKKRLCSTELTNDCVPLNVEMTVFHLIEK